MERKIFVLDEKMTLRPAFERNNVPVVLMFNNYYAPYGGVFIQSLLDHASEENNYDVVIFQRDISKENKRLLKSLAAGYTNVSVRFYDASPFFADYNRDDNKSFAPIESYCKIIAPFILNYPGRIIAVDPDTLLQADIARLIDEDLAGYSVGAVCDVPMIGIYLIGRKVRRDYIQNVCGFGPDDIKNYINTGLLLFDRNKYIRELDLETILNTAQQGRYLWGEQDALSILMKGKIKHIDFAWNVVLPLSQSMAELIEAGSKTFNGAYERALENPCLLHWTGIPKPWICPDVPYGSEWWQTAIRTPFVGHIIARMADGLEKRRQHYREKHGKEDVEVWDPTPKGIDRTKKQ